MSLASLRNLFGISAPATSDHRAVDRSRLRLALERLEDKIVLATLNVPADFATITAAEAAATTGDTIRVAAGDYRSEGVIVVDVAKLNIEGAQEDTDPTEPGRTPAGPNESTVAGFDLRADKIEIEGFTVNNTSGDGITTAGDHSGYEIEDNIFSGNLNLGGAFGAGILLRSNGQFLTQIEQNWFTNAAPAAPGPTVNFVVLPPAAGLGPNGWDIRNFGSDGPLSRVHIEENLFSESTQFGSAVDLEGSTQTPHQGIEIESNHFENSNGIIFWNISDGLIQDNIMNYWSGNAVTPANGTAISIKGFLNNVKVEGNDLYAGVNSGDGIRVESTSGPASPAKPHIRIEDNEISGNLTGPAGGFGIDAIHLINTHVGIFARIHDNTIRHMGRHGINLEGRSGGSVSGVIVEENDIGFMGVDGIHLENANGNTIRDNKSNDNAGSGIQVTNSDNNIIRKNTTRRNNFGIQVNSQSDGNTFNSNTSFDNTTFDYRDSSNGAGTAGTANTWTKNKGNTANPPGLIN